METQDHETIQGTASGPDDGGDAITSYDWRYKEAGPGNPWISVTGETALVVDFDGLNAETDYRFQVKARNSIGLSSRWSPSGSAETDAEPVTVQEAAFSAESGDPEATFNATAIDPPAIPTQEIAFSATSGDPEATFNATAIAAPTVPTQNIAFTATSGDPEATFNATAIAAATQEAAFSATSGDPEATFAATAIAPVVTDSRDPAPVTLEMIAKLKLGSGDKLLSLAGLSLLGTKNEFYEPRVVRFGNVQREIGVLPGEFRGASFSIDIDNTDQWFSTLKAAETSSGGRSNSGLAKSARASRISSCSPWVRSGTGEAGTSCPCSARTCCPNSISRSCGRLRSADFPDAIAHRLVR